MQTRWFFVFENPDVSDAVEYDSRRLAEEAMCNFHNNIDKVSTAGLSYYVIGMGEEDGK